MARNSRRSRGLKKLEPAVETLYFNTPVAGAGGTTTSYIDLSQCASLLNRRFYRQGLNWAVSRIQVFSGVGATVVVSKLPTTWVMSNAWEKSFRAWQRMNNEALEGSESVKPRFLDFKIYADSEHHAAGFGSNLLPKSVTNATTFTQAIPGEWAPSQVHIPSASPGYLAADRELIAVGASYPGNGASGFNAVSLIEGYAASRALPNIEDPILQMIWLMLMVLLQRIGKLHCLTMELSKNQMF